MSGPSGMGLAALCVALIGAFVPGIGLFIGWLALGIATVAALMGDRGFTIATIVFSAFAFIFLTPSLWAEALVQGAGLAPENESAPILRIVTIVAWCAPIVGLFLGKRGNTGGGGTAA